jgi:ribosome-associated protein
MPVVKDYSTEKLVDAVVLGMQEKKANNIVVLNLKKTNNSICDYFVICEAESTTQVDAIAGSVEYIVKRDMNENSLHKEGFENAIWILLDYMDVVVHIFQRESREFYDLETFWEDAEKTEVLSIY